MAPGGSSGSCTRVWRWPLCRVVRHPHARNASRALDGGAPRRTVGPLSGGERSHSASSWTPAPRWKAIWAIGGGESSRCRARKRGVPAGHLAIPAARPARGPPAAQPRAVATVDAGPTTVLDPPTRHAGAVSADRPPSGAAGGRSSTVIAGLRRAGRGRRVQVPRESPGQAPWSRSPRPRPTPPGEQTPPK